MDKRILKQLILVLILLLIFIWVKKDDLLIYAGFRPAVETLDFNEQQKELENRPVILSRDEEININVFEQAHPAVVNITATTLSVDFFRRIIPREGQGSGFIINKRGYILTNNHVVAKAQEIKVTLADGKRLSAVMIGRDPYSDLAVIKVPEGGVNAVALLGDSDQIKVGQKAIAIGNPFGLSHTLTTGIVSALHRSIMTSEDIQIDDLIQTDAAINPGNSGGPLLNSSGEVIGINTAIFTLSGGYQGIGFAIPINKAKEVSNELISSGRVLRPWLGASGFDLNNELAEYIGLTVNKGALIQRVYPGSPADMAGLKGGSTPVTDGLVRLLIGGDLIVSIDKVPIKNSEDLLDIVNKKKVGQEISIGIYRGKRYMELKTVLTEKPY
ncbi:MAG: trypsin-like peptidase domain-containing protein [Desulfobacteraceae bacterium]|jgi:putative serine protease PepD